MRVVRDLATLPLRDSRPVVATLGNFDGIHLGHQAIMQQLLAAAEPCGGDPTVITFHPHPLRLIAPERAPRLMLTGEQKEARLEALGIETLIVIPFDRELANTPAESFMRELLHEKIRVTRLFVGPDYRFGRGRAGDVALLSKLGASLGMSAEGIEPVMDGGVRVSASLIRQRLARGEVREAARLLGREFSLVGTIVHGEGRGSELLFPTANLAPENQFLPGRGVYVTRTRLDGGGDYLGVTNVGIRPTFGYRRIVVETFLPGFEGDLYGERSELDFLERIRDERRFDSPQALKEQIARDLQFLDRWCSEPR